MCLFSPFTLLERFTSLWPWVLIPFETLTQQMFIVDLRISVKFQRAKTSGLEISVVVELVLHCGLSFGLIQFINTWITVMKSFEKLLLVGHYLHYTLYLDIVNIIYYNTIHKLSLVYLYFLYVSLQFYQETMQHTDSTFSPFVPEISLKLIFVFEWIKSKKNSVEILVSNMCYKTKRKHL